VTSTNPQLSAAAVETLMELVGEPNGHSLPNTLFYGARPTPSAPLAKLSAWRVEIHRRIQECRFEGTGAMAAMGWAHRKSEQASIQCDGHRLRGRGAE